MFVGVVIGFIAGVVLTLVTVAWCMTGSPDG